LSRRSGNCWKKQGKKNGIDWNVSGILESIPAHRMTRNNPEKLLDTKIYRKIHEKVKASRLIPYFFRGFMGFLNSIFGRVIVMAREDYREHVNRRRVFSWFR